MKAKSYLDIKKAIMNNLENYSDLDIQDISFKRMEKNNGVMKNCLTITTAATEPVSPTIYIDDYIEQYEKGEMSLDDIVKDIAKSYAAALEGLSDKLNIADDVKKLSESFENAKSRIFFDICNTEMNAEKLDHIPHRDVEDLSLIYRIMFPDMSNDDGIASGVVSNEEMKKWGVTEQDLFNVACESTKQLMPTKISTMKEFFVDLGMPAEMFDEAPIDLPEMYIITNEYETKGAAAALYDTDSLNALTDKLGSGVFLIPSSVNEFLAMVDNSPYMFAAEEFADMIQNVNETGLDESERLGNQAYHYDKERGFELASDYESREIDKDMSVNEAYEVENIIPNNPELQ